MRLSFSLERPLPASRSVVWRALSEPDQFREWWGPQGFVVPEVEFVPEVGAGYRIAMQPPEGELFHLRGEFRAVDPPGLLAFTFEWDPPDPDDRETLATLTLEDRDGESVIRVTQGDFATAARLALHEAGWDDTLDRLSAFVSE